MGNTTRSLRKSQKWRIIYPTGLRRGGEDRKENGKGVKGKQRRKEERKKEGKGGREGRTGRKERRKERREEGKKGRREEEGGGKKDIGLKKGGREKSR